MVVPPRIAAAVLAAAWVIIVSLSAAVTSRPAQASSGDIAVLSAADADRYRMIFAIQEQGRWQEADRLVEALTDTSLMGHVQYQRYMHPTAYRSKYRELRDWLALYADHPGANAIYNLAKRRGPDRGLTPPTGNQLFGVGAEYHDYWGFDTRFSSLPGAQRAKARSASANFRRAIWQGATLTAKRVLRDPETKAAIPRHTYDGMRGKLGFAYFLDGHNDFALEWAGAAARRSGHLVPEAHWAAGLAAWRLGQYADSAAYFEGLAQIENANRWLVSGGAYWAARAFLKAGQPQQVNPMLQRAAMYPRTFYGVLARRALAWPSGLTWIDGDTDAAALITLAEDPQGKRILALLQVGQRGLAEKELGRLSARADDQTLESLMGLAERAGLASAALRLAGALAERNHSAADSARYPMPHWQPQDGFLVDRALLFALARQESRFDPGAKSPAGARGLMQIMPRTASYVARDRSLLRDRTQLFDPELNLSIGQAYLRYLLQHEQVGGDLLLTVVAYNAGPGNLRKWRRRMNDRGDPLLFIESLPARETRLYVERVLTNLWIYRDRLGQPSPSLDALAAGFWPAYQPLDAPRAPVIARAGP